MRSAARLAWCHHARMLDGWNQAHIERRLAAVAGNREHVSHCGATARSGAVSAWRRQPLQTVNPLDDTASKHVLAVPRHWTSRPPPRCFSRLPI